MKVTYLIIENRTQGLNYLVVKIPFKTAARTVEGIGKAARNVILTASETDREALVRSGYRVMMYDPIIEVDGKK